MDPEAKVIPLELPEVASTNTLEEGTVGLQTGVLARLRYYESILDAKMGIESHGPKRILPEEKQPPNQWVMFIMWGSTADYTLGSINTGFLGVELGLSLPQCILITLFGTLLGCMAAGWCATLGPGTGLRQVAISRYSLGWWPSKIIAVLNVIEQLGWSAIGCITGGQALSIISGYSMSVIVGIVIIAVISIICSIGGYKAILQVEQYFWIPFFLIFLIIYGQVGKYADINAPATATGPSLSGSILTLLAIMYGAASAWCSIISDYYVHYPTDTSKVRIFLLTTFGLWIPMALGLVVGFLMGSTTLTNQQWADQYDDNGISGLLLYILHPSGFAKFLVAILSLSGVGLNAMAIYSAALSIQQFAKPLQAVPRFIWSLLVFAAIIALAVGGRTQILNFLSNFLSLLGYYNTVFVAILSIEHYYFRKGDLANYDLEGWNTPSRLPIGFAGLTAFSCGIAGAILGMVETYYVGCIAKMIGTGGGDIGNELALVFTVVTYFPLRALELKYVGR